MRKIHAFLPMDQNSVILLVARTMLQLKRRITVVRIAVARFEFISATPIFARIAVAPANNAESTAQNSHSMLIRYFNRKPRASGRIGSAGTQVFKYSSIQGLKHSSTREWWDAKFWPRG